MKNDEVRCRSTSETIFEMRDLKWNADQRIVDYMIVDVKCEYMSFELATRLGVV